MDIDIEDNIFYDEVMNKLNTLENSLYLAKDGTKDIEIINEIFRSIHTVKGVCDLLGFMDIVKLTHKTEDLLDEIRSKKIDFTPAIYYIMIELKGFISALVTDELRGRPMSPEKRSLFDSFLSDITAHLPSSVLVMESDKENIQTLENISKNKSYKIISDASYKESQILNLIEQNNVKIVICDISFENEKKEELLKKIYQYDQNIFIVLSVETLTDNLKVVAKSVHAKAWIKKPFNALEFETLIDKILK